MDGFGDALGGTFDVENQLSQYGRERAEACWADRLDDWSFESPAEFEERREWVRETVREQFGGLPDRPTDPASGHHGTIEQDGYRIERVSFESQPGFTVTANCYVPGEADATDPRPAVLYLCGHVDSGKADALNQRACVDLARNGFVVCILDPIGQGERRQFEDVTPENGATVEGGGGTFPHVYAGQSCFHAGANLARYMVADARAGLDYLARRSDVDASRVGVTGTSGGGTQTIYLGLFDDRVAAAAPCCCVSTRVEQLQTGSRTHAEQAVTGSLALGVGYDDLLAGLAPTPVCVGAGASDHWFPIEGVHETIDRVRGVYELFDAGDPEFVVRDIGHCSVFDLRDGVFPWLCDVLDAGPYEPTAEFDVLDVETLHCTDTGRVLDRDGERAIDDLVREYVEESDRVGSGSAIDPAAVHDAVTDTLHLDRDACDLHPRTVHETAEDGFDVEYVWFRTERDPDAVVAGVLVSDPETVPDEAAIVCYERGTAELPERTDDVLALAREYGAVFIFDPRGVGAVRNRVIPVPAWADEYDGMFGTECKLANDALLLDDSLLGMRAFDVSRAVDFVRDAVGVDGVRLVGEGIAGYHVLYGAAVSNHVASVTLRGDVPSFETLATTRGAPYEPGLTVFDVLGGSDVPAVVEALRERGVRVDGAGT